MKEELELKKLLSQYLQLKGREEKGKEKVCGKLSFSEIYDYINDNLTKKEEREIEEHLLSCESCLREFMEIYEDSQKEYDKAAFMKITDEVIRQHLQKKDEPIVISILKKIEVNASALWRYLKPETLSLLLNPTIVNYSMRLGVKKSYKKRDSSKKDVIVEQFSKIQADNKYDIKINNKKAKPEPTNIISREFGEARLIIQFDKGKAEKKTSLKIWVLNSDLTIELYKSSNLIFAKEFSDKDEDTIKGLAPGNYDLFVSWGKQKEKINLKIK